MEKVHVTNEWGTKFDYALTVNYMEDDIREELHSKLAPCTEQEFFDAYCKAYEDKYGEEWIFAEENPVI